MAMIKNYIEKFTIPFWQAKVNDWEIKKRSLLNLYELHKANMAVGDQYTDYNCSNDYHFQVESILMDDLLSARTALDLNDHPIRINSAWFQLYEQYQHHTLHNHGINGFSSVCYIEYDSTEHEPTRFVAPFNSHKDNNVIEFIPENIEEGSIIFFPNNLSHYVAPNKSMKPRLILSFNLS